MAEYLSDPAEIYRRSFASIRADQIDLTRTKAIGVKHLKGFLDFAARGPVALPSQDDGSLGPVENVFEAAI